MEAPRMLRFLLLVLCLKLSNGAPVDEKEKRFAMKFLRDYHYLSPLKNGNHNLKDALRMFQVQSEIPDTGQLDTRTIKEMHKPRCGVPDRDEDENAHSGRVKRFSAFGTKWTKRALTYRFTNYASNGGLTSAQQRAIVRRAFTQWEGISPLTSLTFTDVTDSANTADITLSFFKETHKNCSFKFDKAGGTLAHALFPDDGILHFDDDETFTDGVSSGTNLFSVTLHEIGHLLGLSHSQINIAIMHQTYKKYDPNMALTDDEKRGIEYIYAQGTAQPDSTMTPGPCADITTTCTNYISSCNDDNLIGANLRKNCPQTCGQCGGQGLVSPCKNILDDDLCKFYSSNNLCDVDFVKAKCKKNCGCT